MGNLPGNHGRGGFGFGQGQGHGMFGGQQTTQYGSPAYPPPFHPGQGPFPSPGYQGHQGQMYPGGYGHGYHPQGYPQGYPQGPPGGYYQQRPGTPVAALGQAASCGSCIACLTCLLCSCSPCIMGAGAGRMSDEAAEDGNQVAETANVSAPHDDDAH